jgi:hypothetical protein
LPINNFGQQRLNGAADWSAAKGGKILLHFQHIVRGVLMLLCPIMAVFLFLCGWPLIVGHRSTDNTGFQALGGFPPEGKQLQKIAQF